MSQQIRGVIGDPHISDGVIFVIGSLGADSGEREACMCTFSLTRALAASSFPAFCRFRIRSTIGRLSWQGRKGEGESLITVISLPL